MPHKLKIKDKVERTKDGPRERFEIAAVDVSGSRYQVKSPNSKDAVWTTEWIPEQELRLTTVDLSGQNNL
jgi:hypothetical protein